MAEYRSLKVYAFRTRFQLFDSQWPGNVRTPLRDLTLTEALQAAAETDPLRVALVDPSTGEQRTYAQWFDEAGRLGQVLAGAVTPGERLAIDVRSPVRREILRFAAASVRLVTVVLRPGDATAVVGAARCSAVVTDVEAGSQLDAAWEEAYQPIHLDADELWERALDLAGPHGTPTVPVASTDVAELRFAARDDGLSCAAAIRHRGLTDTGHLLADRFGLEGGEVWVFAPGVGHEVETEIGFAVLSSCGTRVFASEEPGQILEVLERHGASALVCSTSTIKKVLAQDDFSERDLSALRFVVPGPTSSTEAAFRVIEDKLGATVVKVFGTDRVGVICANALGDTPEDRSATVGQPLPHIEVKIIDPETRRIVPPGTTGEILVRGFGDALEFVADPDEPYRPRGSDGWMHAAVFGSLDKWGYLTPADPAEGRGV